MSDTKCARMMFHAAERDLLTLRSMTADAPEESFGFHVQQATEKALKAWLALLGETYPLTHNLETLLRLFPARNDISRRYRTLTNYTPYAVEFRSDAVESRADPINRHAALALVEALLAELRRQLTETEGSG